MRYDYKDQSPVYTAPFIANGSLSLQIGPDGSMNEIGGGKLIRANPSRAIWWEGRRYPGEVKKHLIPFGCFTDSLGEAPLYSDEELLTESAEVHCDTHYPHGQVQTTAFVYYSKDLIILRKTLLPADGRMDYTFTYAFCDKGTPDRRTPLTTAEATVCHPGGAVSYTLTDRVGYRGVIRVVCDGDAECTAEAHKLHFRVSTDTPRTLTFYLFFADTIASEDFAALAESEINETLLCGYDSIREEHRRAWEEYYREGYAYTGEEGIDRVYMTAQYHVKSFATRYSLPVGLNDTTWGGKFFGFDEHYMAMGLLTSGHMGEARRVPEFRKTGLDIAVHRASSRHHNSARYPWETLEDGNEASPPGFYFDHIFHMAAIPLSGWMYYVYTGDLDFLRDTVYPVMESCCEFFRLQMLYRVEGGRLIVGKCTDLERMGSAVENAYMTTCGVIATFRAFAAACRLLGVNPEMAEEHERLARDLYADLPEDGEKFLPYPGCNVRSIAAFAGTHPFDVIERDDPRQIAAIEDYLAYEDTFGNMYEVGSGVCSWYACWKGVVFSRLGRAAQATEAMRYVVDTAGDFGDLFEINNAASKTYMHPWFTTAAGMFTHAVNEALLQSDEEGNLYLLRGITDDHTNIRFRLAAKGGLTVDFEMENGELRRLEVRGNRHCRLSEVMVHLPATLGGDRVIPLSRKEA